MSKSEQNPPPRAESAPRAERASAGWPLPGAEQWRELVREQTARLAAYGEQAARAEAAYHDRLRSAANESAALFSESLGYLAALTAEWRKLAIESGRRFAAAHE